MHNAINFDDFLDKAFEANKEEVEKKVYTSILLNIFDKVLRKVLKEATIENEFYKLDSFIS